MLLYSIMPLNTAQGAPLSADFVPPDGVDFADFAFFANRWLDSSCVGPDWCDGTDLDSSGTVDTTDLRMLAGQWLSKTPAYQFLRTEYEGGYEVIGDIDSTWEGIINVVYSIESGNEDDYYSIIRGTGVLTYASQIPDQFGVVTEHNLVVRAESMEATEFINVQVVDGYDYIVSTHPHTRLLDGNQDTVMNGPWTAYNNLWGIGRAVPGVDFRIAILVNESTLPNSSAIVWDCPGKPTAFGGASVWNFSNFFIGNRHGMRTDVPGYPFKIADKTEITLEFDVEKVVGDDQFKIALNTFLTDESVLVPFGQNDGDFFFVPDQLGRWIPNYPVSLPDIDIGGKSFAVRYDLNASNGYERRRVIIKNRAELHRANVDLMALFDMFADAGYLNKEQHIYHLMFGVEVTKGFGAVKINNLDITYKKPTEQSVDLKSG